MTVLKTRIKEVFVDVFDCYERRKETTERVFADAKEKHAMRYTPYRGLSQVTNWVSAMNLKKVRNSQVEQVEYACLLS